MIDINIQKWEDTDLQKLTNLFVDVRQQEGRIKIVNGLLERIISNLERASSYISDVVLAYHDGNLVGWLVLCSLVPSTVFTEEWNFIVARNNLETEIASKLINQAIKYTKRLGRESYRIFLELKDSEETDPRYRQQKAWYEAQGLTLKHQVFCMECNPVEKPITRLSLPSGFDLIPLADIKNQDIHDCYFETFMGANDRFVSSLKGTEREAWFNVFFDRSNPFNDTAYALRQNKRIIGFLGARDAGGYIELGPIGIHPDFQGKGFGKILLSSSLSQLAEQNQKMVYLEVDTQNSVALSLYQKYGFRTVSQKIGYAIFL